MKRLNDNKHILSTLKDSNKVLQKHIVRHSKPSFVKCIEEICYNTVNGNVKLNAGELKKLKRYKKAIRFVAQPKVSISRKKKALIQHGGFLPTLIGIVLSAVLTHYLNNG